MMFVSVIHVHAEPSVQRFRATVSSVLHVHVGGPYDGGGTIYRKVSKSYPGYWEGEGNLYAKTVSWNGSNITLNVMEDNGTVRCVLLDHDNERRRLWSLYQRLLGGFGYSNTPNLTIENSTDYDPNYGNTTNITTEYNRHTLGNYKFGYERETANTHLVLPGGGIFWNERITICNLEDAPETPKEQSPRAKLECYRGIGDCPASIESPN